MSGVGLVEIVLLLGSILMCLVAVGFVVVLVFALRRKQ